MVGIHVTSEIKPLKKVLLHRPGKELLNRYGSGAIPLYLVFDTQGELLGRIQGAAKPDEFMDNLQTILDRQKPKQGK